MDFIDSPTERATAITDAMLAIECLVIVAFLLRRRTGHRFRIRSWAGVFAAMALASALGAIAHGIEMTPATNVAIWAPLNLALGLIMALFAVAAVCHAWDDALGRRTLRFALGVAAFFFLLTQFANGSFVYFIAYEATTILVVLALCVWCLHRRDRRPGSVLLTLGVTLSLVAAMVDSLHPLHVVCIWEFDNHGIFHLIQMVALVPLAIGAVRSCAVRSCAASDRTPKLSEFATATS